MIEWRDIRQIMAYFKGDNNSMINSLLTRDNLSFQAMQCIINPYLNFQINNKHAISCAQIYISASTVVWRSQ